jgi:hypothetical protein
MKKAISTPIFAAIMISSTLIYSSCNKEKDQDSFKIIEKGDYSVMALQDPPLLPNIKIMKASCHQKGCPTSGVGCTVRKSYHQNDKNVFDILVDSNDPTLIANYFSSGGNYVNLFPTLEIISPDTYAAVSSGNYYISREELLNGNTVYYVTSVNPLLVPSCDDVEFMFELEI